MSVDSLDNVITRGISEGNGIYISVFEHYNSCDVPIYNVAVSTSIKSRDEKCITYETEIHSESYDTDWCIPALKQMSEHEDRVLWSDAPFAVVRLITLMSEKFKNIVMRSL